MKHIINYIIVNCFIAICILGCGETSPSKSNVLDSSVDKKILWEMGGHLPAQTGMLAAALIFLMNPFLTEDLKNHIPIFICLKIKTEVWKLWSI